MNESVFVTQKMTSSFADGWHIWGWEVSLYLFLGGLTAGILILSAMSLLKKKDELPVSSKLAILWAPIFLSLGMFFLFLDLTNKINVLRFYMTFHVTSVMSWGSWILLVIYPVSILLLLSVMQEGYPGIYKFIRKNLEPLAHGKLLKVFDLLVDFSIKKRDAIAKIAIPSGIALGIYTGILLSAFNARPLWNSAILGPLFLVSGISTGTAFVLLLSSGKERKLLLSVDSKLILTEIFILFLFFIGQITGGAQRRDAVMILFKGDIIAPIFWIFVVFTGLLLPLMLEWLEERGIEVPQKLQPLFVLAGGLALRIVLVEGAFILRELSTKALL